MSGHGARREAPSWNLRRFKGSEGTGSVAADRRKTFGRHPRRGLCPHVGTARVGKTRGSSRLLANAGRGVLGVFTIRAWIGQLHQRESPTALVCKIIP
jgi:hypothetical protein